LIQDVLHLGNVLTVLNPILPLLAFSCLLELFVVVSRFFNTLEGDNFGFVESITVVVDLFLKDLLFCLDDLSFDCDDFGGNIGNEERDADDGIVKSLLLL
jgi:hypothetical protein